MKKSFTLPSVHMQEQTRTNEEVKAVLRNLLNRVQDLEAEVKDMKAEVKDMKAEVKDMKTKVAEQDYFRLIGDGISEVRTLVAMGLGLESWSSLAAKLLLEKPSPQKPWRAKIAGVLQIMGLDLSVWDSLSQVLSELSNYCHSGSTVSSSYLYQLAMNSQPPASLAAHKPNLVKAMSFLKNHNKGL